MRHDLILVRLSAIQIERAKAANGKRKRITHALLCGPYGQRFGTELDCRKYFEAWRPERGMFPNLFRCAREADQYEINNYETTFNLVMKLIAANERGNGQ